MPSGDILRTKGKVYNRQHNTYTAGCGNDGQSIIRWDISTMNRSVDVRVEVETVSDVTVTCVLQKQTSLCDGSAWPEKSRVLKALTRNNQQDAGTNDNPRLHTHLQFPPPPPNCSHFPCFYLLPPNLLRT